jgi:hypothetical protein
MAKTQRPMSLHLAINLIHLLFWPFIRIRLSTTDSKMDHSFQIVPLIKVLGYFVNLPFNPLQAFTKIVLYDSLGG